MRKLNLSERKKRMRGNVTNRIACIGAGYWGKNLVRNFHELGVLSWVCELDCEKRADLSTRYSTARFTESVEEVLADPEIDGVAIATPAESHGRLVEQSLLADKDVFVEKPLCLSLEEGQQLVALASERKRVLMVGHLLWYHPAVLKLRDLVKDGELGRILYIYSNRLNLGKIRREENILWSFAPHDISVILGLVGEMPDATTAQGGNYLHDQIADATMSLLSFGSGVKAHIFVSWLHPFKEQKLVVVGDRKMAVFNDLEKENKLLLYPHDVNWRNHLPVAAKASAQPVAIESVEPLRAECEHFLECIATRQTPRTDGEEALRVLTVIQQCQKALDGNHLSKAQPKRLKAQYFVHESAFVDENVEIGEGTSIWHVSHILRNSRLGRNCRIGQNVVIGPSVTVGNGVKIQNNVSVYEGVTLEDNVFCGPSMVFTNVINPRSEIPRMSEVRPTVVRKGATLGANCTIICGVTIGQFAFIGAGAVVTKDVPDFGLVIGNPARLVGWMCVCGNRIHFNQRSRQGTCSQCQRLYHREGNLISCDDASGQVQSASQGTPRPNLQSKSPSGFTVSH